MRVSHMRMPRARGIPQPPLSLKTQSPKVLPATLAPWDVCATHLVTRGAHTIVHHRRSAPTRRKGALCE